MDHSSFLKSLSEDQRRQLTTRSNRAGLRRFALHLGLIVVPLAYVQLGLWLWPLAMLAGGVCLIFLFTLMHETVHLTPFRSVWLNHVSGAFCGFLLGLAPLWFRYFHLAHHRYTQDPTRDPELAAPKPSTKAAYFWHMTGLPMWRYQALTLVKNAFWGELGAYVPKQRAGAIRVEARLMLAAYLTIATLGVAFGWSWLFWLWIGPLLLGQPFLRAYLLAEHAQCDQGRNMFTNTRTTFTTRAIRFLAWNMPYHAEHHAYPTVPFHALPKLHDLAKTHLGVTQNGYVAFNRDYAKNLSIGQE